MSKKRFASYLFAGKAAAFPFMMDNSFADTVPTYNEMVSTDVRLIEMPVTGSTRYVSSGYQSGSSYGGSSYGMASFCNSNVGIMNVVITGAKSGDIVILAASSNKDSGEFSQLNRQIRLGSRNLTIVSFFKLTADTLGIPNDGANPLDISSNLSIPVDLNSLEQRGLWQSNSGSGFYLQALVLGADGNWSNARASELDSITPSASACSGSSSTYGGGY